MEIEKVLSAFKKLKILIIGDVMADAYLTGTVDRVSPEAPVPIVNVTKKEFRPGGAANVALNVSALGATPVLCSVVGEDVMGGELISTLPDYGISTKYLIATRERKTTVKTRVIAQNQQILRFDEEDTFELDVKASKSLLKQVRYLVNETDIDAILFQDYNKGILTEKVIREVLLLAIRKDIPTIVDPKHQQFFTYKRATLFKPNLKEVNDNLPFSVSATLQHLTKATEYINRQLNNEMTLITLSDKGIFYSQKEERKILPTIPRNIADVCGAGDSVVSVAACALAIGLPLPEIALLANLAGGQVCEQVGVVPVSAKQLISDYEQLE
ncbi:MAG: PfkB family carbohydrate kinase [Bacteroidota bacterium]